MSDQPPIKKRQIIKYLWAIAVSGLVIAQVMIDKENKYLPLIHRALDLLQRQYQLETIPGKSTANQFLGLPLPTSAPSSSMNTAETPRPDLPSSLRK
jgi:hypothetical protein